MARRPVNSPYSISGSFGDYYGSAAKFLYHSGIDYALPTGREVYAPIAGTVTTYTYAQFHGNVVQIFDGQFYHRLMHNSQLLVKPGQKVTEGQLVAKSGATGEGVTGPHVHWDICTKAVPTAFADFKDPVKWLAGNYITQGEEMITDSDNEFWRWNKLHLQIRGRNSTRDMFRKAAVGQTWLRAMETLSDDPEADAATNKAAELTKIITIKDNEITRLSNENTSLKAQMGDTTKWQTLRTLLRELLGIN